MSAETLRRAAALMRERAEAAGRDWNADCEPGDSLHLWVTDYDPSDPTGQTAMQRLVGGADAPWSEHIASWHPAVALAVADWLEAKAEQDDKGVCDGAGTVGVCNLCEHDYGHVAALTVARAYLGSAVMSAEVLICEVGTCAEPAQSEHSPCCSSTFHGKSFCCEHYCRSHFVEAHPCSPETHSGESA